MSKPQNPVQMAVIGAAHGIKGELRVKTFTGEPLALADYGPLYAKDGRAFQIVDIQAGQHRRRGALQGRQPTATPPRRWPARSCSSTARCCPTMARRTNSTTPTWSGWRSATTRMRTIGKVVGGAQFRRRRHSRRHAWRAQRRADPVHRRPPCRRCRSPTALSASTRRLPGWSRTRMARRRCDEGTSTPKGRPRGPKDAGGNR